VKVVVLPLLAGLALPALASADVPAASFGLDYAEHEGCPSAADFRRRVEARVPESTAAVAPGAAKIGFRINFATEQDALFAHLVITVDGEVRSHRRIPAASCSDAVESMAVIAAIVVEGRDVPPDSGVRSEPEVPAPLLAPATTPAGPPVESSPVAPVPAASAREPAIQGRALAAGALMSGAAPVAAPGAQIGGELRWNGGRLRARAGMLYVPPIRVSSVAGADAVFHLLEARALLCASLLQTGRVSWNACAGVDAGQLVGTGEGERVQNAQTQHAAWFGAGLSALPEIALTSGLSLELGASLRALGPRDHFVLKPGVPVHDVPQFSWDLTLGTSILLY
jgi:hypothetical protein